MHNPNVLQIALLKLKKNLNSIQGLTQRVLKPYMNSGASITYLGLSNDRNDGLDEEDKEVCNNTVNVFLKSLKVRYNLIPHPNAYPLASGSGTMSGLELARVRGTSILGEVRNVEISRVTLHTLLTAEIIN